MIAVGFIGFVALVICLVMVIVNMVRKEPTKYWSIGLLIAFILVIVGIVGLTASPAPSTPTSPGARTAAPTRAYTTAPTKAYTTAPTSALTATEKSYVLTVIEQGSRLSTALTKLSQLCKNPDFTSIAWKLSVASEITTIQGMYSEALAMRPPSSMAHIHDQYLQATQHLNNSMILLTRGIDNLDDSLITQGTTETYAGVEHLKIARTLAEGFSK